MLFGVVVVELDRYVIPPFFLLICRYDSPSKKKC